jgi:DNA-binding IclR family transcriptional regulator
MASTKKYNVKSVENAFDILNCFMTLQSQLSAVDIQKELSLSPNMAFRLLTTMTHSGYLRYNPETEKYRPSLKILQLCNTILNTLEIRRLAMGVMYAFNRENPQFNNNLAVLEENEVFSVHRFNSEAAPRYSFNPGTRLPPHASSVGKALIMGLDEASIEVILKKNGLERCTEKTITDKKILLKHLAQANKEGIAWSRSEYLKNIYGVAAPIRDNTGKVIASLSISCFSTDGKTEKLESLIPRLKNMAYDISYGAGYQG